MRNQGRNKVALQLGRLALVVLCAACLGVPATGCQKKEQSDEPAPFDPQAEAKGLEVCENWLSMIDGEDWAGSWVEATDYFKRSATKEAWRDRLNAARTPLGALKNRSLRANRYTTTLPGAPDGEYVHIEYDSVFENREDIIETIILAKDKKGTWRVSGYFLR